MNMKRLDGEESMADILPADKVKLNRPFPVYRNKRNVNEKIKKELNGEEKMADDVPAYKVKLDKLIPIYRDKRRVKERIKKLKNELANVKQHIERVSHMEKNLALRESVFSAANIDLDRIKEKKQQQEEFQTPYYDKKVDKQ